MTEELMLSPEALTGIMDRGYLTQAAPPRFPVRLSGLGRCPRALRMELAGAPRRPFAPRSLRVFEQGHQRGEALARAWTQGLRAFLAEREGIKKSRFIVKTELEAWLPTSIRMELAELIADEAVTWIGERMEKGDADPAGLSPLRLEHGVLSIRGRADLVLFDMELEKFWVIDFKTKNSWGFKKLEEEGVGEEYLVQLLAYARALEVGPQEVSSSTSFSFAGAFVFYEDHDRRSHKVLEVPRGWAPLESALADVEHVLRSWATHGPESEAMARFAHRSRWAKPRHKGAAGCLPWQCNYCSVGPEAGKCVPDATLDDISKFEDDVPRWEVWTGKEGAIPE